MGGGGRGSGPRQEVGGGGADGGEIATGHRWWSRQWLELGFEILEVGASIADGYRLGGRGGRRSSDGGCSASGGDDAVPERRWLGGVGLSVGGGWWPVAEPRRRRVHKGKAKEQG